MKGFEVGAHVQRCGYPGYVTYKLPDPYEQPYKLGGYLWAPASGQWIHATWTEEGRFLCSCDQTENDLMPPRREYWVNEYAFERQCFGSQEGAETYRLDERKDCVHVVELGPNEKIVPKGECE